MQTRARIIQLPVTEQKMIRRAILFIVTVHGFRVQRLWVDLSFRMCMIMPDAPALPFDVSPACHARPENKWKQQLIGSVHDMVEETNGS